MLHSGFLYIDFSEYGIKIISGHMIFVNIFLINIRYFYIVLNER